MNYQIVYTGGGVSPYRVDQDGVRLKARFHTRGEAEQWIAEQTAQRCRELPEPKGALATRAYTGRVRRKHAEHASNKP